MGRWAQSVRLPAAREHAPPKPRAASHRAGALLENQKRRTGLPHLRMLFFMVFSKRLRDGVRRGDITCSVRIWKRLHVKVGSRYRMEEGEIEVDSIEPIGYPDITPALARASGFLGVVDLLKVAKHGAGESIYLIRFHYVPPRAQPSSARRSPR